uniref:Ig-like domain-containing protein n=1 Tax=Seriola dumerili TaxID=41447 RepID=A0A3B4VKH7_SERDU
FIWIPIFFFYSGVHIKSFIHKQHINKLWSSCVVHVWRQDTQRVSAQTRPLEHWIQNPSYNFRTRVFVDELEQGNVSMKIFSVKLSDEGKYRCYIHSVQEEAFIHLMTSNRTLVLQCESKGWYPEPELLWLDGEGKLLSAGPTETVRGPDDLYTVSSGVTVEKRHSNSFTCRVQQKIINQTRETQIHVPGRNLSDCPVKNEPTGRSLCHLLLYSLSSVTAIERKYRSEIGYRTFRLYMRLIQMSLQR